jgi:type VI secretion system protein ImpB
MPWAANRLPPRILRLGDLVALRELQRNFDMAESLQHKLDRVRSPRVHITYDVETGGAIEKKELPFVMGVFGDFTGQPEEPLPRLKDRKFVEVNPDNFDSVLAAMKPHLAFSVENKISDDPEAGQLRVNLKFKSMEDFEPTQVAKQIKPLNDLLDLRTKLSDLRGSLQGNDKLDDLLQGVLRDTANLDKLKAEVAKTRGEGATHE